MTYRISLNQWAKNKAVYNFYQWAISMKDYGKTARERVNTLLTTYNAKIIVCGRDGQTIEFDSNDDATEFLLRWS